MRLWSLRLFYHMKQVTHQLPVFRDGSTASIFFLEWEIAPYLIVNQSRGITTKVLAGQVENDCLLTVLADMYPSNL